MDDPRMRSDTRHRWPRTPHGSRGWHYEFAGLQPSTLTREDGTLLVQRRPSLLRRLLGARTDRVAFHRYGGDWRDERGGAVEDAMVQVLEDLWHRHQPPEAPPEMPPSATSAEMPPETPAPEPAAIDVVQLASEDSFPASDAPAWTETAV